MRCAVGLTRGHDVLGLLRLGDDADRPGLDVGLLAHACRQPDLIARTDGDLLGRRVTARTDIDEVAAQGLQLARGLDRVLDGEAAFDPVGRRDAHAQRLVARPRLAAGLEHLERKAPALFHRAAILVAAPVAERREELVQQIAVRAVQLDQVETQPQAALDRRYKRRLHALEADCVERHRRVPGLVVGNRRGRKGRPGQIGRIGLRQRSPALPRPLRRGLAPGMAELNAQFHMGHPAPRPFDDRLQRRFVGRRARHGWPRSTAVRHPTKRARHNGRGASPARCHRPRSIGTSARRPRDWAR